MVALVSLFLAIGLISLRDVSGWRDLIYIGKQRIHSQLSSTFIDLVNPHKLLSRQFS